MKSFSQVKEIVDNIKYKDFIFRLLEKGDGYLLQVLFDIECVKTGKIERQHCRKWYLSSHSCTSEIVKTAFKAIESAELHEIYENFLYKGKRIFDPHLDVNDIVNGLKCGMLREDVRSK